MIKNTNIKAISLVKKEIRNIKKDIVPKEITNADKNNKDKLYSIKINTSKFNESINTRLKKEEKYFEFNAHFKYSDLFEALTKLMNNKNESTSNTSKANINNNYNANEINELLINNKKGKNKEKRVINKIKPRNRKVVSRNNQIDNYMKYAGYR